ncbi:MAG TPA: SgcJ/EcaC family oxidoreductase [Terriglobales bacterium]|jgi:uncharacterized protein (TIGR02246 family)|nr:SgcJ/EcaC family oxidoreductase [Terriglobales bacterium]
MSKLGRVLLSLFALTGIVSFGQTVPNEARTAADAMLSRFINSWNHADGQAYGENYWPEAELVDPSGAVVKGKTAIVQEHVDLWNGMFKGSRIQGTVRRIRMLGPKYMMVDLDLEVSNVRQLPPGSPYADRVLRNHLKHILEKRNGAWKVIAAQNTFIAPRVAH